jgi:hypothetical protein
LTTAAAKPSTVTAASGLVVRTRVEGDGATHIAANLVRVFVSSDKCA